MRKTTTGSIFLDLKKGRIKSVAKEFEILKEMDTKKRVMAASG